MSRFLRLPTFGTARTGASIPPGQRVYAIGDIHGRLDLFERMIGAIEEDDRLAEAAETTAILLGDLIDRGPDPAGVVALAREWQARRKLRILVGNHEEMFIDSFTHQHVLRHFLRYGGEQTLLSYGICAEELERTTIDELQAAMDDRIPAKDRAFIQSFEDMIVIGGYVFVHAGIAPGIDLDGQQVADLRWIREPFLSDAAQHSHVVVHGHTITEEVVDRANRIGIDTGAYRHGCLTAVVLEGYRRRFIEVRERDGTIEVAGKGSSA